MTLPILDFDGRLFQNCDLQLAFTHQQRRMFRRALATGNHEEAAAYSSTPVLRKIRQKSWFPLSSNKEQVWYPVC
jgi:hypothetical protein